MWNKISDNGYTSMYKDLSSLFSPRSIAVIGASENPGAGRNVLENLRLVGFSGKVFPVNPKRKTVLGLPCFSSVKEIPEEIDFAAILLSRDKVIPALKECQEKGVKASWAFASGFAEAGEEGKALQHELRTLAEETGLLFCGPNCVGLVNLSKPFSSFSAPLNNHLKKGGLSCVVQSGSICLALTNSGRGIGFSKIVSTGNEAVLTSEDYVSFLLEDPETEVIALFIEGFRKPELLFEISKRSKELNKPIVVLKVGRSELAQRATVAHTGALAGSDRIYDALFRKLGFIKVEDLDEMLETCEVLLRYRKELAGQNKVGAITVSGGEIGLIADISEGLEFDFPSFSPSTQEKLARVLPPFTTISNPLDAWGSGDLESTYPPSMELLAQEDLDMILVSLDATSDLSPAQSLQYQTIARAARETRIKSGKKIIFFSNISSGFDQKIRRILEDCGVPCLQGTRESLKAASNFLRYSRWQKQDQPVYQPSLQAPILSAIRGKKGFLPENEAKRILEFYGIRRVPEFLVHDLKEAINFSRKLRYPLTLKIHSSRYPHKTEVGGVILRIRDEEELKRSFSLLKEKFPDVEEFLLGSFLEPVAEAILGIIYEPYSGPVLVFGSGGIFVELIHDSSLRLPPLDQEEAKEMVQETKIAKLISGFRGKPRGDHDALYRALVQLGKLALDLSPYLKALDINPLFIMPEDQGVLVVDALMELR